MLVRSATQVRETVWSVRRCFSLAVEVNPILNNAVLKRRLSWVSEQGSRCEARECGAGVKDDQRRRTGLA